MSSEINIAADLQTRGCPVCSHVIKVARDFFARWQFALASDDKAQSTFAAELGFCPLHLWQLHSMSSPWGESAGLARLTDHVSDLLAKAGRGSRVASNVQDLLRTPANCRVCRMLDETENAYIKRLGSLVEEKNGRQLYQRSQGVCLRHLARLLVVTSEETGEFLLTNASRRFQKITEQMRSYAAKRDAVRRDLINRDEEDSSVRAMIHLVGAKDYSAP